MNDIVLGKKLEVWIETGIYSGYVNLGRVQEFFVSEKNKDGSPASFVVLTYGTARDRKAGMNYRVMVVSTSDNGLFLDMYHPFDENSSFSNLVSAAARYTQILGEE